MDPQERIHSYFDDSLTQRELAELSEWIKADPENAREFAKVSMLHDRLKNELEMAEADSKIIPFSRVTWLASAAAVLLALAIWQLWPSSQPITDTFVTIARAQGANLKEGEKRGKGALQIASGMVRLLFDSGVDVTIQGPALFELIDGSKMVMKSGLLTATVPKGAEGFRVDTPTAQITDLGTSFGVYLDSEGASRVSVFDGEVEVAEPKSGTKRRLTGGQEARVTQRKLETISFDPKPYEKLWPVSSGIEGSTGSFKLAPPWPRRFSQFISDEYIYIVPDGYRTELNDPLRVNVSEPGKVARHEDLTPLQIPAGTALRSFLIHYRPTKAAPRRFATRLTGSITFDRPVVGVIVLSEEFKASSGIFSRRRAGGLHPRRELELTGTPKGDRISLSEDMRTLKVDLTASLKSFDLIRVVVDASSPTEG